MTTSDYLIWSALIAMAIVIFVGEGLLETDDTEDLATEATTLAVSETEY